MATVPRPQSTPLELRVLGPLEVAVAGVPIELGPARQRALLAALIVRAGQVVSVDRLIDDLWGERPPASAHHALQVYVSNLRKLLDARRPAGTSGEVLVTRRPGYLLAVGDEQLDSARFESRVAAGRRALAGEDAASAAETLRGALALWRGPAFADLAGEAFCQVEAARLEELRLGAIEDRVAADLQLGRHTHLAAELEAFVAEHPLRERLWEQFVLSLYRCGRQADALRTLERVRRMLAEELGLSPGPALRELEEAILRHDTALGWRTLDVAPASSAPPAPVAPLRPQRRTLTALAVEVVEPPAFVTTVPAADRRVIAQSAAGVVADAVEAFGGAIVEGGGSQVVAVFGLHEAHEDDAERAVRAGLRIAEELAAFGADVERGWDVGTLTPHVGIVTGVAVIDAGDEGPAPEVTRLAADVAATAPPGGVLVAASTRRLVEPLFEWASGHGATVARAPRGIGKFRGLDQRAIDIVGRERELVAGGKAIDAVLAGAGGVLFVTGEAGIGKTRLIAELRSRFATGSSSGGPPLWVEGRCASFGQGVPYGPFRELLREWLGTSPQQPQLRTRVTLRREVDALFGEEASRIYPLLATVLGLPLEREVADAVASHAPDARRGAIFDAVRSLIERLAADRPVVLAIEDVHWADPTSVDLIDHLLPATDLAALLIVLAERPEENSPSRQLRESARRGLGHRSHEIDLLPLPEDAAAVMLRSLLDATSLPAPLDDVLRLADGNPFFLEELVRSLLDGGHLTRGDDGWHCDDALRLEVPHTVEGLLLSRIDRLAAPARDALDAGAVLGRQFAFELADVLCDAATDVGGGLRELQRADLVREVRRWPQREYRFKHALVHEVAYQALAPDRRRELHRRAAHGIETVVPDRVAESYAVLARHCREAGELGRAAAYYRLAGDGARAVNAVDEAIAHFSAGVAIEEGDADVDRTTVAGLRGGRGRVWFQRGDHGAAAELERALAAARAAGDRSLELEALEGLGMVELYRHGGRMQAVRRFQEGLEVAQRSGDDEATVMFANRLTIDHVHQLRLDRALASSEAARAAAARAGTRSARTRALDGEKLVALAFGDLTTLRSVTAELRKLLTESGDLWYLKFALAEASSEAAARGAFEEAHELLNEAVAINQRLGDVVDETYFLTIGAWLDRSRGDFGAALTTARQAVAVAEINAQRPWWRPWAEANLGAIQLQLGDIADAIEHLDRGRNLAEKDDDPMLAVRCSAHLAWGQWLAGDPEQSARCLAEAVRLLGRVATPPGRAWLAGVDAYDAVARTLCATGRADDAAKLLTPLLGPAREAGWHEVCSTIAVRLGASVGPDAALPLLQEALESARAGGCRPLEQEVHDALAGALGSLGDHEGAKAHAEASGRMALAISASIDDPDVRIHLLGLRGAQRPPTESDTCR